MRLTTKQLELIKIIAAGNPDGTIADLDEVMERLSYKPSKESLQFSIRALIAHGLIIKAGSEKRRLRRRVLIGPTELGKGFAWPTKPTTFIASEEDDELMLAIDELVL